MNIKKLSGLLLCGLLSSAVMLNYCITVNDKPCAYTHNQDSLSIYNQNALNMISYTQSDQLELQRLSNIKVAIIDEGITKQSLCFTRLRQYQESEIPSHGTLIANLLGAPKECRFIYHGLIPSIPLYGYSLSPNEMNTTSLANAIKTVTDWGVDIISISMGTNKENDELKKAVQNAINSGIVIICSSGNNPYDANYPASFIIPGVISVGAVGNNYNILPNTNVNSQVDIYAPGEDIASFSDDSAKVTQYSGTSVAVPFVTLACVYIKAYSPSLSPADVDEFLSHQTNTYLANWGREQRAIGILNMAKLKTALNI